MTRGYNLYVNANRLKFRSFIEISNVPYVESIIDFLCLKMFPIPTLFTAMTIDNFLPIF